MLNLLPRADKMRPLTSRGNLLLQSARPHLVGLVGAALSPGVFDPKTNEEIVRLGLSDASDAWLLSPLLQALASEAPRMRLIVQPIQFRTVAEGMLSGRIDLAITVADDLPAGMRRAPLFSTGFVCLFDPRSAQLPKRLSMERLR